MNSTPSTRHDETAEPPAVTSILRDLDSRWRGQDVPRAERRTLLQDVRADLLQAHAATGSSEVTELLGTDTATFALAVVRERGAPRSRGRYLTVLVFALLGVLVAVVGIWPLLQSAIGAVDPPPSGPMPLTEGTYVDADGTTVYPAEPLTAGQEVVVYGGCVLAGLLAVASMLTGVHLAVRRHARAGATVWRAAVLVPISVGLSLPTAIYYAGQTNYSTAPAVVLAESSLVLGGAALAVVTARWWALRAQRVGDAV